MIVVDVIDYGAGNLASVQKAMRAAGAEPRMVTTPGAIASSTAVMIPGVGHFSATRTLDDRWRAAIRARIDAGAALLGICLGMQWLFEGSDEAPDLAGLGVFPGRCFRLSPATGVKIPHVGWNTLAGTPTPSRLLRDAPGVAFAYFTHTFAAPVVDATTATTTHGAVFTSVVESGRVFGTQWHPEKSGTTGIAVLTAFVTLAQGGR